MQFFHWIFYIMKLSSSIEVYVTSWPMKCFLCTMFYTFSDYVPIITFSSLVGYRENIVVLKESMLSFKRKWLYCGSSGPKRGLNKEFIRYFLIGINIYKKYNCCWRGSVALKLARKLLLLQCIPKLVLYAR